MFTIVSASGSNADPKLPGTGPMLSLGIKLNVTDATVINMTIESLNGATRDHRNEAGTNANVQIFHIMCSGATSAQQFVIRDEINKDRAGFYDQLLQCNDSATGVAAPLSLYRAPQTLLFKWPPVIHPSYKAEESLRVFVEKQDLMKKSMEAGATAGAGTMDGAVPTPCYVLIVSSDPENGGLLDATLGAVVHPASMAAMAGP